MALVIDASSPATHTVAPNVSDLNTCAAFTPPDDVLLLALWTGDSQTSQDTTVAPVGSSSPSLTWTRDVWDHRSSGSPAVDGQAALFHAQFALTIGSTTVTIDNGEAATPAGDSALAVLVLTGHDPATPIGVSGGGRQSSGTTLTASYTASITGGQGFLAVADWTAASVTGWAAATGCTIIDKGTVTGGHSYAFVRRTAADGSVGVSTSLGLTGLTTGGAYHWAYAEVISWAAAHPGQDPEWAFGQCFVVG